jgi:hypothetical protein
MTRTSVRCAVLIGLVVATVGRRVEAQPSSAAGTDTETETETETEAETGTETDTDAEAADARAAEAAAAKALYDAITAGAAENPLSDEDYPDAEPLPVESPPALSSPSPDRAPQMSPDMPVQCLRDRHSNVWRVQCGLVDGVKTCIYAPSSYVGEDGTWGGALERTRACDTTGSFIAARLTAGGATLVRGVADAPRGWQRDLRGRVFQIEFDLHKRVMVGVDWLPGRGPGGGATTARFGVHFAGLEVEAYTHGDSAGDATRHRVALLRGEVALAPFAADVVGLHWDGSRQRAQPLVRVTTFFGAPRRFDIFAHLGWWVEAGHLTVRDLPGGEREDHWRVATAHLTWDVARSHDMYSYLRVRGGVGGERASTGPEFDRQRDAVTPGAAIEGDVTFDQAGMNHLSGRAAWEHPIGLHRTLPGGLGHRVRLEAAYERILIALNDQPITLRLGVDGLYSRDEPTRARGWDLRALVGLRFNLWAPAR